MLRWKIVHKIQSISSQLSGIQRITSQCHTNLNGWNVFRLRVSSVAHIWLLYSYLSTCLFLDTKNTWYAVKWSIYVYYILYIHSVSIHHMLFDPCTTFYGMQFIHVIHFTMRRIYVLLSKMNFVKSMHLIAVFNGIFDIKSL